MSADARELFAASEIATAIGWSKARVTHALKDCPASGSKELSGNRSQAWALCALPEALLHELERLKIVHRYRTAGDVLRNPVKPWQPATPLLRTREEDRRSAERLRVALADALAMPEEIPISERARFAAPSFQREFGYAVSHRHLQTLISRTIDRDRGARKWQRLEIYLPDAARAERDNAATPLPASAFDELQESLSAISNVSAPTPEDRGYCWRKAVEFYDARTAAGAKPERLKRELCSFLYVAAPFLADSRQAMKRNLNRKLATARAEGVEALHDRRATNSGRRRRPHDWEWNVQLLAQWTLIRHGRIAQAWRELYLGTTPAGDQFSQPFRDYFAYEARMDKSRVPATVRTAVRPMIAAATPHQIGPRAVRLAMPSIPRDWSDTAAGDYYTADDVTINHLWFEWNEFGEYEFAGQRFNVGRGQWLLCCDERTDLPLGFLLMPRPTYNSAAICTLNARIFGDERVGLPFKGMKYEQGIWKARNIAAQFSWSKIEEGFARHEPPIALTLRHATTPRAKVIERVIGSAQNMMDHLPGYIGRCEPKVKFEREQKFLQSLKRVGQPRKAEVDPREMMLSKEEISDELAKVLRAFANEPQGGGRLAGLSPAEAWAQLSPNCPHHVLPDSLRYLLTTNRSEQTVTNNGVRLKIGGESLRYVGSERLGELRGEKVRVFFNPELPEQVSVIHPASDPKGVRPFSVPLFERVPANTATAEDFERARSHQRAFAKYGADSFRLIAPPRNLTMRNERLGTPELRERGERLNELEGAHRALQTARAKRGGEIARLATRQNLAIDPAKVRDPERVAKHLARADQLEEQLRRMEAAEAAEHHE